jgi:tRNA-Thr(GGU) m(6)t(6)A37 methyltransferase TsaA
MMHNNQHAKDVEKWINKVKNSISDELGQELTNAIQYYDKMNEIFESIKRREKQINNNIKQKPLKKQKEKLETEKVITSKFLKLKRIGVIRTPYKENAPYQPVQNDQGEFQIVIDSQYMNGLSKLDTFNYIYVIYYIHRIKREVKNVISPPWTGGIKVGIFASRSPVRPNFIGLSVVRIKRILNNIIFTTGLDVFDKTPLLDIKPYIKDLDSKSDANYGWIEDLDDYEHLLLHIKGIPHDY